MTTRKLDIRLLGQYKPWGITDNFKMVNTQTQQQLLITIIFNIIGLHVLLNLDQTMRWISDFCPKHLKHFRVSGVSKVKTDG